MNLVAIVNFSSIQADLKVQQDPQWPWSLIGLTMPVSLQSFCTEHRNEKKNIRHFQLKIQTYLNPTSYQNIPGQFSSWNQEYFTHKTMAVIIAVVNRKKNYRFRKGIISEFVIALKGSWAILRSSQPVPLELFPAPISKIYILNR